MSELVSVSTELIAPEEVVYKQHVVLAVANA